MLKPFGAIIKWEKYKPGHYCCFCQSDWSSLWTQVSPRLVILHPWCQKMSVYPLNQRSNKSFLINSQDLYLIPSVFPRKFSFSQSWSLFTVPLLYVPLLLLHTAILCSPDSLSLSSLSPLCQHCPVLEMCVLVLGYLPLTPFTRHPPSSALWGFLCFFIWPFRQHRVQK